MANIDLLKTSLFTWDSFLKNKRSHFVALSAAIVLQACVTSDPEPTQTKSKATQSPTAKKSTTNLAKNSNAVGNNNTPTNSANVEINARVAMEFYLKHLTTHQSLDIDDKMTVGLLEEKRSSKIQLYEAAYFLGWLKVNKEKLSFKSVEDYQAQTSDFLRAVATNALLQHPRVAVYFQIVSERAKSQGMVVDLNEHKAALKAWIDDTSNAASALADIFDGAVADQSATGAEVNSNSAGASPPSGDEGLLVAADEHAGNGEAQKALSTLAKIRSTSPVYSEATSRIQKISTTQVMTLRKKAAEEFQKALPVPDGESKKAMLMNAKRYLEEALKDYPQAAPDQIVKTKTNLDIIVQKIEQTDVAMKAK